MNIKNIQQYRSFYKTTRPVSDDLEEHFIGNFYFDTASSRKKYGWFTMYHGDKDGYGTPTAGIENFLQSFLDMAKDGQAVYEFLQNAVDAGSTHYTMVWGQDEEDGNYYLLVANNGNMFDLNSVRSILNVGSSTKTADSQTIGKFGIGFKLAHRLVGKDNGLQELINENSGPLLFSWKNYEIATLASGSSPVPVDVEVSTNSKGEIEIADDNPWLFKILITCFPCLPANDKIEELPRMANGGASAANPFSNSEYEVLTRWVRNNLSILNQDTYQEGSLFFIKLGSGKETELAENNLKEGVKFALAILKETADTEIKKEKVLRTVQLNNEEAITYPDLEYIKLTVDKRVELDTYAYIRFGVDKHEDLTAEQKKKVSDEADIEALFGFRKHTEINGYFKGAPNLYLYFPLSEEVHNFNYILHSNAFYKGSSRTFLHKGSSKEDGINERLLKTIVSKIDVTLSNLSSSADSKERELFLHLYAALLTSGRSLNQDRLWIESPYINPIDELLKKYVPVRKSLLSDDYEIASSPEKVFIKNTNIDIETKGWGLKNVDWFYWGEDAEATILSNAAKKLEISGYTIFDLLQVEGVDVSINNWIGDDQDKMINVLKELQNFNRETTTVEKIKPQLLKLKLLVFSNGETLSLAEFLEKEKEGYFLVHNTLGDVRDILLKAGLTLTVLDLNDYKFIDTYRSYLLQGSKHRGYTELTQLFSSSVDNEKLTNLSKSEKLRLFNAFRTFNSEAVTERIKELKLFTNNLGIPVCFKNLFLQSAVSWLDKFSITTNEYDVQLKSFLLDDEKEVYQYIIYPFWDHIANYIAADPNRAKEVLARVVTAYTNSNWLEKQKNLLSSQKLIIFQSQVIETSEIFYHEELLLLPDDSYTAIQDTSLKYFGVNIPDKVLVPFLDELPFSFSSATIHPLIDDRVTNLKDLNDLLLLTKICNVDFFNGNCIIFSDGVYSIDSISGKKQIATVKAPISQYINTYYPNEYVLVPDALNVDKSRIELSDNALVVHLIERFEEGDDIKELELIEIVLEERFEDKKALLLNCITFTKLDASWVEERQNELYLRLLKDVVEGSITGEELTKIHKKISIIKDDDDIVIGDVDSAHDSIEVLRGDKKIILSQAQILNLENAETIKLIQAFHDEAKKRDLVNTTIADILFKISNTGITDELVEKFNARLSDKQLENSHQLLFVLLSNKFKVDEFNEYSLKSQDNVWYKLQGQLIIYSSDNSRFVKRAYLINESYTELQSLLQLNDLEVFNYGEDEDDIIASHFLFVKGFDPAVLESVEAIHEKLTYLQKGWAHLSTTIREYKRDAVWDDFLSISPSKFVLNGIQTEQEILPQEFISWYQNDRKKEEILRACGVYVGDSPIEKVRKYLLSKKKDLPNDIDIQRFNETLLLNTIDGLAGAFTILKNQPFIYSELEHTTQLSLIERIINQLVDKGVKKYPVLIYHSLGFFKVFWSEELPVYRIDEALHSRLKEANRNNLQILYSEYNILKQSLLPDLAVNDIFEELQFEKTFVPSGSQLEHDEPFYHSWKAEHNLQLYRENDLRFDISIDINSKSTVIGRVSEGVLHVDEGEDVQKIFYNKNISLEELRSNLSEDYDDLSDAIEDLINRRNAMLASIYNALNAAGKGEVKSNHLEALELAFKEEDLKRERKELIESIKENTDYSYVWFEKYIEFLLTYESKQSTTTQKSISFQEIKRYIINEEISNKYFLLCGASSVIPLNIEDFEDFKISLVIKNRSSEKINVEGVSKKGQDLLIYCREPISPSVIGLFNEVIQIKISFSPVIDLLERLYNAFKNRANIDVWDDINDTLPNLEFIYGPPGTGKTTTLCSSIIDGLKGNPSFKYLLLTPTNKAADVLCKKILKPSNAPGDIISNKLKELGDLGLSVSITRVGKPTDPELEEMEDVYQDSLNIQWLDSTNVLASTIHRIPYFEVIDAEEESTIKLFKLPDYWDYVVFDESSMTNLPYLVFAILAIYKFNPNAKFIIAGDPKQIPPVVDVNDKDLEELDIQDENVYTMMGINSFKRSEQSLRPGDTINNLKTQFRSVQKIGQLFSDLSYSNLLKHDRGEKKDNGKPLPDGFKKLINQSVTFIDFPLNMENSIFRINKLLYSSYHIHSAIFVAELIRHFDSLLTENESWSIGLIAPYKAQAILLNKLITSYGISEKLKVYSDTVHGFQGDECDIVFFISNPNNYYYTGHSKCLLSKEYIYNVAISRARDYLVILHPFETIKNNPYINSISASYAKNFGNPLVRKSTEFEKILFNRNDFIEKNSYITGHDNVNIFGQIEMKYFIKANEGAIDIQLRRM